MGLVRNTRYDFRSVQGTIALVSVMTAGEFGGRKLGERAGLRVLLDELPQTSELRAALVAARQTGVFTEFAQERQQGSLSGKDESNPAFPDSYPTRDPATKLNKYGDPVEEGK